MTPLAQDVEWLLDIEDETRRPTADDSVAARVPSNDYATSWKCEWNDPEHGIWSHEEIELLRHVNCSYLSSGKAPTLLALKQHAQSLTNLIKRLSVSSTEGAVDNKQSSFHKNEAFDWLNDLDVPYKNEDNYHNTPIYAIANQVRHEAVAANSCNIELHCPLQPVMDFGPFVEKAKTRPQREPYQTHANLLHHANECLEILDHEYSATGGFLSILPTKAEHDKVQLQGARNTLVGQWLLHHQHLMARMHELEINYANALDALAGEAVVPLQMLSNGGPDVRSLGRQAAYPQDRFLLVNSGDDVFNHIHQELNKNEAAMEAQENLWRASGVSGERMWSEGHDGAEYARGLVSVNLTSRFYRIKGQNGKGTLFVIPAAEVHPGVQQTRKIEERPTIVSLVTPTWPERVTDLKRKYEEQLKEGSEAFNMKQALLAEREERKKTVLKLADEKDKAESKAENFRKLWVRCQSSLKEVAESLPEDAKEALLELLQESGSRTPSND